MHPDPRETSFDTVDGTDDGAALQSIDLLLEQGAPDELEALRQQVAEDPLRALDLADTVDLIERLRTVRVEPGPAYAGKLHAVVSRAGRRLRPAPSPTRWLLAAASALLGFGVTAWLQSEQPSPRSDRQAYTDLPGDIREPNAAGAGLPLDRVPTTQELARSQTIDAMRRRFELEAAAELSTALDEAEHAERNPLASWLRPRNMLALRRLDHELRKLPEIRLAAMRSEGAMLVADDRVQALADDLAEELSLVTPSAGQRSVKEAALAIRALIAAGVTSGVRQRAFAGTARWLTARLPELFGEERVLVLAALVECAGVEGRAMPEVAAAGDELLASVLAPTLDIWQRRRPYLLTDQVSSNVLGDAGHTLAMLPGLGADAARCVFVRRLLLGKLQERRANAGNQPDLLAAMLYGFGDLLAERDRDEVVLQLRRWKPVRLAPDFVTVHQIAWGVEPGRRGFTRLQLELRQLVVVAEPESMAARAALCLCLASNYAAFRPESLDRFSAGD